MNMNWVDLSHYHISTVHNWIGSNHSYSIYHEILKVLTSSYCSKSEVSNNLWIGHSSLWFDLVVHHNVIESFHHWNYKVIYWIISYLLLTEDKSTSTWQLSQIPLWILLKSHKYSESHHNWIFYVNIKHSFYYEIPHSLVSLPFLIKSWIVWISLYHSEHISSILNSF